jgi:predicted alpha/beta superfamily hydrolase
MRTVRSSALRPTRLACSGSPWAACAVAQDKAEMTEAQNDAIYDAEPRDPDSGTATSFRQWCQDTLKPAVQT